MLLIMARCQVIPEHWEDFSKQVEQIIPLVHLEPGCIRYELHSDVYTPGLFIFHEEWESQQHLDDHIASKHMKEHFSLTTEWMASPVELMIYTVTDVEKKTLS
jgi:quinol monooxygenase YgiN